MRYLFKDLAGIVKQISAHKTCVLMLDFDGTLSPIASSPDKAKISNSAKAALLKLIKQKNITPAIISGRSLKDLKNKVGIRNLIYAGNHGLEWQIGKKIFSSKFPKAYRKALPQIYKRLLIISKKYRGALVEHKGMTLTFHYRQVNGKEQKLAKNQVGLILLPYAKKKILNMIQSNKAIDIRPRINWTKGGFVFYLAGLFGKSKSRPLIIYVGDDTTDEDAFKVLKKGITVRVGKKGGSFARYFIKNSYQVAPLLKTITKSVKKYE